MEENKLFVYGTLKSTHGNHRCLHGATKVGEAVTVKKYGFYKHGIPYVTDDEKTVNVKGELYTLSDAILGRCDRLEGHPRFYTRKEIEVKVGNEIHKAWCYINNNVDKDVAIHIDNGEY